MANTTHTVIKGLCYRGVDPDAIRVEDRLTLVREMDNPRDPNAVMVVHQTLGHVGYLPKGVAGVIAPKLDAGHRSAVRVTAKGQNYDGAVVHIEVWVSKKPYPAVG